jgi:hypothetical protein
VVKRTISFVHWTRCLVFLVGLPSPLASVFFLAPDAWAIATPTPTATPTATQTVTVPFDFEGPGPNLIAPAIPRQKIEFRMR